MTGYSALTTDQKKCGLNGRSTCFLCLKKSNTNENVFSLRSIYRYLQINCQEDEKGRTISGGGENADAIFCDQCATIMEPLTKLCTELELLQMRAHQYLKSVNELLEKSQSTQDSINQENVTITETDYDYVEFTKLMRNKLQQKCQIKLSQAVPKVMLAKDVSTPLALASDEDVGGVVSDCETPQDKITKYSSESHTVKNSDVMYYPCNLCDPTRMVHNDSRNFHEITHHLDNCFLSSKNSSVTLQQFKEYCFHMLRVELRSCATLQSDEMGRRAVVKCQYCQCQGNMELMRGHIFTAHKEIISNKLVELQRSTPPHQLRTGVQVRKNDDGQVPSCSSARQEVRTGGHKTRKKKGKKRKLSSKSTVHAVDEINPCACVCGKTYSRPRDASRHVEDKLSGPVTCPLCAKTYKRKTLPVHIRQYCKESRRLLKNIQAAHVSEIEKLKSTQNSNADGLTMLTQSQNSGHTIVLPKVEILDDSQVDGRIGDDDNEQWSGSVGGQQETQFHEENANANSNNEFENQFTVLEEEMKILPHY